MKELKHHAFAAEQMVTRGCKFSSHEASDAATMWPSKWGELEEDEPEQDEVKDEWKQLAA